MHRNCTLLLFTILIFFFLSVHSPLNKNNTKIYAQTDNIFAQEGHTIEPKVDCVEDRNSQPLSEVVPSTSPSAEPSSDSLATNKRSNKRKADCDEDQRSLESSKKDKQDKPHPLHVNNSDRKSDDCQLAKSEVQRHDSTITVTDVISMAESISPGSVSVSSRKENARQEVETTTPSIRDTSFHENASADRQSSAFSERQRCSAGLPYPVTQFTSHAAGGFYHPFLYPQMDSFGGMFHSNFLSPSVPFSFTSPVYSLPFQLSTEGSQDASFIEADGLRKRLPFCFPFRGFQSLFREGAGSLSQESVTHPTDFYGPSFGYSAAKSALLRYPSSSTATPPGALAAAAAAKAAADASVAATHRAAGVQIREEAASASSEPFGQLRASPSMHLKDPPAQASSMLSLQRSQITSYQGRSSHLSTPDAAVDFPKARYLRLTGGSDSQGHYSTCNSPEITRSLLWKTNSPVVSRLEPHRPSTDILKKQRSPSSAVGGDIINRKSSNHRASLNRDDAIQHQYEASECKNMSEARQLYTKLEQYKNSYEDISSVKTDDYPADYYEDDRKDVKVDNTLQWLAARMGEDGQPNPHRRYPVSTLSHVSAQIAQSSLHHHHHHFHHHYYPHQPVMPAKGSGTKSEREAPSSALHPSSSASSRDIYLNSLEEGLRTPKQCHESAHQERSHRNIVQPPSTMKQCTPDSQIKNMQMMLQDLKSMSQR